MEAPTLRILSLGAGVQSTTVLLLAAEGRLPKPDAAIFANTGWEPRKVYAHLERLNREVAEPAGIPIYEVSAGNIRDDALDPTHRFASMPLFIKNQDGGDGMTRRQCSNEYKVKVIKAKARELLGYPHPKPVPRGVYVEQWIGISRDEIGRAKDADVQYMRNTFPLLDMSGAADGRGGWTRDDCERYLAARMFGDTPKSACIGCPFHGNAQWRRMRDNDPEEWADAVAFDRAIRSGNARGNANGKPLLGEAYLHRSRLPLDQAPIDRVTAFEWAKQQTDVFGQIADAELEDGDPDGCSPWSCRSGTAA
jgi:3'-phosphoadenosine 5'-phosphosulfate sulfotransferase (PAPS reductase)/FAD synthetase